LFGALFLNFSKRSMTRRFCLLLALSATKTLAGKRAVTRSSRRYLGMTLSRRS